MPTKPLRERADFKLFILQKLIKILSPFLRNSLSNVRAGAMEQFSYLSKKRFASTSPPGTEANFAGNGFLLQVEE